MRSANWEARAVRQLAENSNAVVSNWLLDGMRSQISQEKASLLYFKHVGSCKSFLYLLSEIIDLMDEQLHCRNPCAVRNHRL